MGDADLAAGDDQVKMRGAIWIVGHHNDDQGCWSPRKQVAVCKADPNAGLPSVQPAADA